MIYLKNCKNAFKFHDLWKTGNKRVEFQNCTTLTAVGLQHREEKPKQGLVEASRLSELQRKSWEFRETSTNCKSSAQRTGKEETCPEKDPRGRGSSQWSPTYIQLITDKHMFIGELPKLETESPKRITENNYSHSQRAGNRALSPHIGKPRDLWGIGERVWKFLPQ